MPNKKTNLGKCTQMYKNMEEMMQSVCNDADAFSPELNDILKQFDSRNPYDVTVLACVVALFYANTIFALEDEYPEFEGAVKDMISLLFETYREHQKNQK